MYNLKITKEATEDIDKIIAYITNVLKNPIAADNLLTEFENSFKYIAYNPKILPYSLHVQSSLFPKFLYL